MNNSPCHLDTRRAAVIWLTGLPGSGKTTIATSLREVPVAYGPDGECLIRGRLHLTQRQLAGCVT
ncbi:adenylyl-sulfate kinase [Paraburkholderia kururiensis]|uniref:adenylyl-sulfate kinase n=1 Tax=Paraburkholderia kururiensis TaxID=984307 RepID=UPI0009DCAAAC|nr:adenylyl-sulfate kinase [Paraburkholderia kururiensis]